MNSNIKKKRKKSFFSDNKIKIFLIILAVLVIIGLTAVGAAYAVVKTYIDEIEEIDFDMLQPSLTSYLYDKNGEEWAKLYSTENRIEVSLNDVPQHVQDAFIAIEDERFYDHSGLDLKAIGRAFISNLRRQRTAQGGSTITQQLVKNALLTSERTYKRKIQEAYLAYQLERVFSKDEILEFYLNWIYFDYSTNGVEAASRMFFNKSVSELSLAEATLLAGVPKSPSLYSPYRNMEGSKNRQAIILNKMVELEMISLEEAEAAKLEELEIHSPYSMDDKIYPHFYDYVVFNELKDVITQIPEFEDIPWHTAMYQSGLHIYTTLDPVLQALAEDVINNPKKYPKTVLDEFGRPQPQANIVLAEPETGYIRVLVGGRDYGKHNQILRFSSGRDTGSAIKPILTYAPALEEGVITAATPLDDSPVQFSGFRPENFDRRFRGLVTMRESLAYSHNIPAVRVFDALGIKKGIEYAKRFGLESLVSPPGINNRHDHIIGATLGGLTQGVTTIEMVQSFSVLANEGIKIDLTTIQRIEDSEGNVLYEYEPEPEKIVSKETAYIITNMLIDTVRYGTGAQLRLNRTLAAKTGTANDLRTGYAMAYTRDYVIGYWMGYDIPKDGTIPAIWNYAAKFLNPILQEAHSGLPVRNFVRPRSVVSASICTKSGLRPGPNCPEDCIKTELFVSGKVPQKECDLHVTLKVCSQSGLLPSEYCPENLLEEKVFLNRPEYLTTTSAWPGGANREPADAEQMPPTEVCDIHTSRPNPPANLSYNINAEMTTVTLSWDAPEEAAAYLVFKKATGEEAFTLLTETPITNRSYTDAKIKEKETYVYQVIAVNASGVYSEAVSVTVEVPEKPIMYNLAVAVEGPDGESIEPSAGSYSFKAGTQVNLKAKDVPTWNFKHWQIEGESVTTDTRKNINITLTGNLEVTAVYEKVSNDDDDDS